ncbi:MAG: arginine--tRNA ligase [Methanomicrobiales archaeon]|nr:arginine--tRNA ligase [Methanomicrobiales archaeon]
MFHEERARIARIMREITGAEEVEDGGIHADLATSAAFALAKIERRSPMEIARELGERIAKHPDIGDMRIEVKGPYVNFHFGDSYAEKVLSRAIRERFVEGERKEERLVVEHTSANPNGPLHVGHIRNSIIGDSLARTFRCMGYRAETQYYVNDIGRQIAIVVFGLGKTGIARMDGEKGDHFIARVYIAANRLLEQSEETVEEIDRLMQQVERGDPATVAVFRRAVEDCLAGINETLKALNVIHNRFIWESDFVRNGDVERVIARVKRLPQCHEDGTLYLDLSAEGIEKPYVLKRSDGTTVYAARDLAYHIWKGHNFDRMIDVLGADHKLIGTQLIATLVLLGEVPPVILHFEFVSLPEGSMSTRAGKFVSADDLVREVTEKAFGEVTKRRPDLPEDERWRIARSVAIGAIRYDIVKVSPEKSTVFDWREALDFERQSGPYVQYAHARACSILAKAGEFTPAYELTNEFEVALMKQIGKLPFVMEQVMHELRPHLLAAYARELADLFNTFYRYVPVLKSEGPTRASRLTLVLATRNALREALEALGIDALSSM